MTDRCGVVEGVIAPDLLEPAYVVKEAKQPRKVDVMGAKAL